MKPLHSFLLLLAVIASANFTLAATDADPSTVMPNEWEEFRFERLAVLRSHPDLMAEDKALRDEFDTQKSKVEAAMIHLDSKVEPILKKLAQLLKTGWKETSTEASSLSSAEWQQLRTARAAALKANPDLAAANKALLEKKRALEKKIDAALVKVDPDAAAFLHK